MVKHNLVKLTTVAIECGCISRVFGGGLVDNDLACIKLANVESIAPGIDAQRPHAIHNRPVAIAPSVEDATGIGPERDDVAEDFEFGKRFIDGDGMALAVTFDSRCEPAKTCVRKRSENFKEVSKGTLNLIFQVSMVHSIRMERGALGMVGIFCEPAPTTMTLTPVPSVAIVEFALDSANSIMIVEVGD